MMNFLGLFAILIGIMIGNTLFFWIYSKDIETVIKRAFKQALKEIYEENRK